MSHDQLVPQDSIEAEEHLLSCCLIDGADVVSRCIEAQIRPESFDLVAHRIVYERLLDLYGRQKPIDAAVLAEELKSARQLDTVGGYAFITQVSSRIHTTAQAGYFIERVAIFHRSRQILAAIERAKEIICAGGEPSENATAAEAELRTVFERNHRDKSHQMDWDTLLSFDGKHDPDCLMGRRFLGRSAGAVIVAPSGVGKSVLSNQLGSCAALGIPFFGLRMSGPLRVLYVQAEDDLGDVAESVQGFVRTYGLDAQAIAELRERFRIVRWNDAAGGKFLSRLRSEHARHPYDLVIINPLFSFCGCNVSDQSEMSAFLRNGLNPILNDTRSAAVIVHHTNKPPADSKDQPDANTELRYVGSGSAELTNWARAYITLQAVKSAGDGVFKMSFAKRGNRAGLADQDGKPTTSVLIEHSPNGLCWVPSTYQAARASAGKFAPKFDLAKAARVYDPEADWATNEQTIALDQDVSRKTVSRQRQNILDTAA